MFDYEGSVFLRNDSCSILWRARKSTDQFVREYISSAPTSTPAFSEKTSKVKRRHLKVLPYSGESWDEMLRRSRMLILTSIRGEYYINRGAIKYNLNIYPFHTKHRWSWESEPNSQQSSNSQAYGHIKVSNQEYIHWRVKRMEELRIITLIWRNGHPFVQQLEQDISKRDCVSFRHTYVQTMLFQCLVAGGTRWTPRHWCVVPAEPHS